MRFAFIFVLFNTPSKEVRRLTNEVNNIGINNFKIYFIDNSNTGRGYAEGVNEGIRQGTKDKADYFVVANPDISLINLNKNKILELVKKFDIGSFAMRQDKKVYYCGEIEKWRLSGHLSTSKTFNTFSSCQYVTGSLMFIGKQVIQKIGLFNENFFMYYEDVDFCVRAKDAGFKVGINTEVEYEHFETSKHNSNKDLLITRSRLIFFLKYSNSKQKIREIIRSPKTIWEEKSLILDQIKQRPFLINFSILNLSSIANKGLNFLLFIFLTRYLSVEEYGIYALVWAHTSILAPLLDFGTTTYGLVNLPNEKNKSYSSLFSLRFFLGIIVFILTILLAFIFHYENFMVLLIFLTSFTIIANAWSGSYVIITSTLQKVYLSSIVSIVFNFFLIILSIIALVIFKSLLPLFILVFLFYNTYLLLNYHLIKNEVPTVSIHINLKHWIQVIKTSYVYVLIALFAGLYFKIDVIILKFLKTTTEVGIYSAGYKFFDALIFIAASYNFTAIPKLSKQYLENSFIFHKQILRDALLLGLFGVLLAALVYLTAPFFLKVLLKSNFFESLTVLRIVIFSLPLLLITTIFLNTLYIFKKAHVIIFLFLFQLFINITLNLIFIPKYSYIASSYITVLSELLNMLITFTLYLYFKKKTSNNT